MQDHLKHEVMLSKTGCEFLIGVLAGTVTYKTVAIVERLSHLTVDETFSLHAGTQMMHQIDMNKDEVLTCMHVLENSCSSDDDHAQDLIAGFAYTLAQAGWESEPGNL